VFLRAARLGALLNGAVGQAVLTAAVAPPLLIALERIGLVRREESVLS
jgi:hypothetical protein